MKFLDHFFGWQEAAVWEERFIFNRCATVFHPWATPTGLFCNLWTHYPLTPAARCRIDPGCKPDCANRFSPWHAQGLCFARSNCKLVVPAHQKYAPHGCGCANASGCPAAPRTKEDDCASPCAAHAHDIDVRPASPVDPQIDTPNQPTNHGWYSHSKELLILQMTMLIKFKL